MGVQFENLEKKIAKEILNCRFNGTKRFANFPRTISIEIAEY